MTRKDFQLGIYNRLSSDAYFTQADEVQVRLQKPGYDLKKAAQDAINSRGLVVLVGLVRFERDYRYSDNEFVFELDVETFENPKKSESGSADDETGRDGEKCDSKAFALLHNYRIPIKNSDGEDVDPFSKLRIQSGGYIGDRDGCHVFRSRIQSRIHIDTAASVLGDSSIILVTENNQPLSVSPTDP